MRELGELEYVEDRPGRLFERHFVPPHPGQAQEVADEIAAAPGVAADAHIIEHRLAREQREVLKGAGNADLGDAVRRAIEQRAAFEQDITPIGGVEAAQAVEQGCLARAVRADQAEDLSLFKVERHAVECDDAAEPQSQVADIEQRCHAIVSGDLRQRPHINPPRAVGDNFRQ